METKVKSKKSMVSKVVGKSLPIFEESCSFEGYDADTLMDETEKLRELITKRGTLEILIPLYNIPSSIYKVQKIYEGI
jgi:hypothetical protein